MNLTTVLFWLLVQLALIGMAIAMGNARLLAIAPAAVWGWMCVIVFVGDLVWAVAAIFRGDTGQDTPRLPDIGQSIKRLLFPAPPVARRHTARARTSASKPERII